MKYKCMHCSFEISKMIQIPKHYNIYNDTYTLEGCFCSYECAKTWNLETNDSYKNIRFHLLEQYLMSKGINEKINFAPHKKQLSIYGGKLSYNEFKQRSLLQNKSNLENTKIDLKISDVKQLSIIDTMKLKT